MTVNNGLSLICDPQKRYDFVFLFDVRDGNPNGDPDAGNLPRVDPETMHGLASDVALKRKVRDYLQVTKNIPIFIQSRVALNTLIRQAGEAKGIAESRVPNEEVRQELCKRYYDIRMFGAVLSTGDLNAGQVRGPVQLTFARSIDPVLPLDISITRKARTTEERMETGETEMGRKPIIPYGLYRSHGFYNPFLAEGTGVSQEDLEAFWEALSNLFELDRSASRGEMHVRGIFVFRHEDRKGNAPTHKLFDLIKVRRKEGVEIPRSFADYAIETPPEGTLEDLGLGGVTLIRLV
ncbi:type I-C CRISPR-associated protein Cas7/Csd2 [Thermanaeromonas sp. C210]|uniref:type I-C CRISPR-associated protein Cas7/Csd2 n=1 Tax=Thermanaeromonas sp. C210 TaxID=2731925 RepID=UPI00155CD544|nr:type I-C CRISPR-associated protein Cas7/Csd2 [Thermanaeromonas sp. C210]GFN22777.1 type I-C CRISPR-associated protein Cas7/Csd2 [Thermanaeromonas sp. C210]